MKPILAALLLTLTACCCTQHDKPLEGTTWKLTSLEGIPATAIDAEEDAFTLRFDAEETMLAGRTDCNRFFGSYKVEDDTLTLGEMGMTRMACPDMEHENAFMQMLERVTAYAIEGDRLTLLAGDEPLAEFKAIELK